jgi:hypothetical protein
VRVRVVRLAGKDDRVVWSAVAEPAIGVERADIPADRPGYGRGSGEEADEQGGEGEQRLFGIHAHWKFVGSFDPQTRRRRSLRAVRCCVARSSLGPGCSYRRLRRPLEIRSACGPLISAGQRVSIALIGSSSRLSRYRGMAPSTGGDREPGGAPARSRALGLEVTTGFHVPALPACEAHNGARPVAVDVAAAVPNGWDDAGVRRVAQLPAPPAEPVACVEEHPDLGWRLWAVDQGMFVVSPEGAQVVCVPGMVPPDARHRFLLAQVLPFVAVLQGLELLHASAIAVDGRAFGIAGASGAGKTSVALRLFLGGAAWMADDVVALEAADHGTLAHPGPAQVCIRANEARGLRSAERARLGRQIASYPDKVLHVVRRHPGPLPLEAVFFLERGDGDEFVLEPITDPHALLGSLFWSAIPTSPRLLSALDTTARLSQATTLLRARVPPALGAAGLAQALARYIKEGLQ